MRQVPSGQVLAGRQSRRHLRGAALQTGSGSSWDTVLLLSLCPSLGAWAAIGCLPQPPPWPSHQDTGLCGPWATYLNVRLKP